MTQAPILIVGGGPVGMTLALALARLGQRCTLVERNPTTTRHPKMDITNARSMEIFRAVGVAESLRAVAVPEDHPFDVAWVTTLAGEELHRFRYPSVTQWRGRIAAGDPTLPGEAPMRVSQVEIEPVLQRHVLAHPLIEARWGVALEEATQDAGGVTVRFADGAELLAALEDVMRASQRSLSVAVEIPSWHLSEETEAASPVVAPPTVLPRPLRRAAAEDEVGPAFGMAPH